MNLVEKFKDFLFARRQAYAQVFRPEDRHVERVLKDLARFCRATDSTFHEDPRAHAVLEGRREVWLRIMKHTKLDADQFWKTYGKGDLDG